MKTSSFVLGVIFAVAVVFVLLMVLGVNFRPPLTAQGAALYNPANEVVMEGVVQGIQDFACPVSEGEVGSHLTQKTGDSVVLVHLAPGRIMRSQKLSFAPGDQIAVLGSKFRFHGNDDLIAREITRGNETLVFRDREGKLMLVQ